MKAKITGVSCEKCGSGDLSIDIMGERDASIMKMDRAGVPQTEIAKTFNVSRQRVNQIVKK